MKLDKNKFNDMNYRVYVDSEELGSYIDYFNTLEEIEKHINPIYGMIKSYQITDQKKGCIVKNYLI